MKRNRHPILLVMICLGLTFMTEPLIADKAGAFSSQVIQRGATGNDVIELQARLQYIGFYKGKIDGKFGWDTYWALRNFQQNYGLPVDGIAGADTKQILSNHSSYNQSWVMNNINNGVDFTYFGGTPLQDQVKSSNGGGTNGSSSSPSVSSPNSSSSSSSYNVQALPSGYSASDIQLMANAVYGESRGEPFVGQVAVAAVILHRVESPKFPDSVSGVIFQPGAFTAVQDGQIWLTPNATARKAVLDAINGWDPSQGALYYFNPDTATSSWIWGRPQILKIGKHIFTK